MSDEGQKPIEVTGAEITPARPPEVDEVDIAHPKWSGFRDWVRAEISRMTGAKPAVEEKPHEEPAAEEAREADGVQEIGYGEDAKAAPAEEG